MIFLLFFKCMTLAVKMNLHAEMEKRCIVLKLPSVVMAFLIVKIILMKEIVFLLTRTQRCVKTVVTSSVITASASTINWSVMVATTVRTTQMNHHYVVSRKTSIIIAKFKYFIALLNSFLSCHATLSDYPVDLSWVLA